MPCPADSSGVHDLVRDEEGDYLYCQNCDLEEDEIPDDDEVRMT